MLAALEALMNGRHSVGRLLPKVQKCCLKTAEQAKARHLAVKSSNSHQFIYFSCLLCSVSTHGMIKSPCSV